MKILGLDLGDSSIGWSVIEVDEVYEPLQILGMGVRIISLSPDESKGFNKGKGETPNSLRTFMRSARKRNHRFKMRRNLLNALLDSLGMLDHNNSLITLSPLQLWKLRNDAATPGYRLSLPQLGRVLRHINKKRGYRHATSNSEESTNSDYVKTIDNHFNEIKNSNETIGQFVYSHLLESEYENKDGKKMVNFRLRGYIFPRKAHEEEFDAIMNTQRVFYPDLLTDDTIKALRNAIFNQRPLKSCKHLVSICDFEKRTIKNKDGKEITIGPKVAPRTSPLVQLARLYETVNNIRLINIHNKGRKSKSDTSPSLFDTEFENIKSKDFKLTQYEYVLSLEERRRIVEYLNTHEKLTSKELLKLIGLTPNDGFRPDKAVGKGIKGNETFIKLAKVLENVPEKDKLLQFNLNLQDTDKVNQLTGEIIQEVSPEFLNQPLYTLWHTIYSIDDKDDLKRVLGENFHLSDDIAEELSNLDFKTPGFANRSARFLRRILPLMMDGYGYAEACETIGIKHSDSLSKEEREDRILVNPIPILPKNSLRQPIVEKIINQMIHIVNDLTSRFGTIDEVRVELARCLKQSADERARDSKNMGERERKNNDLSKKIEELGLSPSKSRIQKFKLWEETGHKCMYCDQPIGVVNFLRGMASEVEHIIPRSIFFDDSLSNKTCACQKCNKEKNNRTAYDFMKSKSEAEFTSYIEKVENLFASNSISRTKRNRLLTSESEIPQDFLERDLRLTQYISKKTCEILRSGIRNVYSSTGSVTDFFRHLWGYDKILQEINIPRYEKADLVIEEEYEHKGQIHKRRKIVDWSKRKDHRHHAIDALVVALTRQGYIQRLNRLSAEHGNMYNEMINEGIEFKEALSLLNNWAETRPHFPTEIVKDEISKIAVSVKKGKKFLTPGKRSVKRQGKKRIVQKELLIPRGPLHQESVVGKILINAGHKNLKFAFSHPELIKDSAIKDEILKRITQNDGSWEKACKSCKKNPIILDQTNSALENVECFEEKFVMKYPIASIKSKHINSIVDDKVREVITQRFEECGNNEKKFEQSLSERPIILFEGQAPVKSIRRIVDLKPDSVVAIRKNSNNENIGFAKSGNNHHVAFYKDSNGKYQATVTSFWIAVKRHKSGLPVIIDNPREAYDTLIELGNETLIEELLPGMPLPDWDFVESLKMNDTFILGMTDEEYSEAINNNNTAKLLNNLYRVQKLSLSEYVFRLHTDTSSDTTVKAKSDKEMDLFQIFKAPSSFFNSHPRRVKISRTGEINYD